MKTSVNKNTYVFGRYDAKTTVSPSIVVRMKKNEKSREIVMLLFNRKNVATKRVCKAKKQVLSQAGKY